MTEFQPMTSSDPQLFTLYHQVKLLIGFDIGQNLNSRSCLPTRDFTNWANSNPLTHHFIDCKHKSSLNLLIHNYKLVPAIRLITDQ